MKLRIIILACICASVAFVVLALLFGVSLSTYQPATLWVNTPNEVYLFFKTSAEQEKFENISWTSFEATFLDEKTKQIRIYKIKNQPENLSVAIGSGLKVNTSVDIEIGWYNITLQMPKQTVIDVLF